jgi:hypothetical protein
LDRELYKGVVPNAIWIDTFLYWRRERFIKVHLMDVEYITFVGTIILQTLIFALSGWWADRVKNGGEFNPYKLLITLLYAIIVAVIIIASGIVDVTSIGSFLENPSVILEPVWFEYLMIYTGMMYFFNKFVDPYLSKTQTYQKVVRAGQNFSPGFTVTPVFPEIKSGESVSLLMEASPHSGENEVIDYAVDWSDGSKATVGQFVGGFARVNHVYVFSADSHYTGKTYYPLFMIRTKTGMVKSYNTEYTGRCCAVGVSANGIPT